MDDEIIHVLILNELRHCQLLSTILRMSLEFQLMSREQNPCQEFLWAYKGSLRFSGKGGAGAGGYKDHKKYLLGDPEGDEVPWPPLPPLRLHGFQVVVRELREAIVSQPYAV